MTPLALHEQGGDALGLGPQVDDALLVVVSCLLDVVQELLLVVLLHGHLEQGGGLLGSGRLQRLLLAGHLVAAPAGIETGLLGPSLQSGRPPLQRLVPAHDVGLGSGHRSHEGGRFVQVAHVTDLEEDLDGRRLGPVAHEAGDRLVLHDLLGSRQAHPGRPQPALSANLGGASTHEAGLGLSQIVLGAGHAGIQIGHDLAHRRLRPPGHLELGQYRSLLGHGLVDLLPQPLQLLVDGLPPLLRPRPSRGPSRCHRGQDKGDHHQNRCQCPGQDTSHTTNTTNTTITKYRPEGSDPLSGCQHNRWRGQNEEGRPEAPPNANIGEQASTAWSPIKQNQPGQRSERGNGKGTEPGGGAEGRGPRAERSEVPWEGSRSVTGPAGGQGQGR